MNKRPLFLGKGRGRGRGNEQQNAKPSASWNRRTTSGNGRVPPSVVKGDHGPAINSEKSPEVAEVSRERMAKAEKIKESAKRFMEKAEDDLVESSEDEEVNDNEILSNTLKNYRNSSKDNETDLERAAQYLLDSCKPGANVCLICIASIKHVDAVWSCSQCYTVLHLLCIQKWARDGAALAQLSSQEDLSPADLPWFCPKCRFGFKQSDCPTRYYCYCEKQENPSFDPWLTPHSCGQSCSKPLKPDCGHDCLLLCHPGPCPPCPKTVRVSCHCGSAAPIVRRCSAKEWSCGKPCGKLLSCGHHNCETPCHSGDCLPCPKESVQNCLCGKFQSKRSCANPEWQCEKVCGKVLSCGHHTCEQVCHAGNCGDCPRAGNRKCPCGQTSVSLPCTEDIPTCGSTCDKLLACNRHYCTQRCHTGSCGTCRQMIKKKCRCGKREKDVVCSQDFLCEIKCQKMRQCERHQCRRKCCNGHCLPCEQICNRNLNCRNHKCPSQCHRGPCYPCPLTVDVKCFCGATVLTLPCGREKVTKPPKCTELCRVPPDCHHLQREPHHCHYGPCPPCRQICNLALPCGHACPASCHDNQPDPSQLLKTSINGLASLSNSKSKTAKFVALPCPPCIIPVEMSCFGQHEISPLPCHKAKVFSCARPCGRQLACGTHTCQIECHTVLNAKNEQEAGTNCQVCREPCSKPRPKGCTHACPFPCHKGDCPSCKEIVQLKCHCKLMTVFVNCSDLTSDNEQMRNELRSCKNQCPKKLAVCGHRCASICHPGPCPSSDKCTKKISVRCPCQRRKKDFPCHAVQKGEGTLVCDKDCDDSKAKQNKKISVEEEKRKQKELKAQQEELERFERRQKGRQRKPRKNVEEIVEPYWFQRHMLAILMLSGGIALVAGLFFIALD
ncbi:NF-X1-type zinc finger protein NFXL1-like [Acropora muricata]|uniref:NF-X1-type zinc finger protein NFXL1-like n=1 Tax=Acropora muricata TaxID=159855 RepID=UPI0034E4F2C6